MREHYKLEIAAMHNEIIALGEKVVLQVERAVAVLEEGTLEEARQIVQDDLAIDAARNHIAERISSMIALQQPVARDLRHFLAAFEIANELERVGDYAKRLAKVSLRQHTPPTTMPPLRFRETAEQAIDMLRLSLHAFASQDASGLTSLTGDDAKIDEMEDEMRATLHRVIQQEPAAAEWCVDRIQAAHTLERIADRSTNIAERALFFIGGQRVEL